MFAPPPLEAAPAGRPWVVAVIDDEPGVHEVSRLVLRRLRFDGRPIEIVSAHSGEEGRQLLARHGDVAVALVDVVMEDDRAGLDLVQHLRDTLGNKLTRVILRTGQPGMAPEREIVTHFEIDDYKDKAELTADRLYTAVYAALRAYQALWGLEQTRRGLSRIADAAGRLMGHDSTPRFFAEALQEMAGMAAMVAGQAAREGGDLGPADLPSGLAVVVEGVARASPGDVAPDTVVSDPPEHPRVSVLAGTGEFVDSAGRALADVVPAPLAQRIAQVVREGGMARDEDGALLGLDAGAGRRCALWVRCSTAPSKELAALWQVFATKLDDVARARGAIEARTEMAAAERELRAKSRFMSRMSHELRTPLNAMLGFTQLMMADGDEPQLRHERLRHITTAGRHLLTLIDDILDLSRLEGGEAALRLESVLLAPLLTQVMPLVAPLAQTHGVEVTADTTDAVVRADATRLRQVLLNLLTNAIKYNRPGGTVHVEVQTVTAAGQMSNPGDACGIAPPSLRVRVIDTGRGLTAAQIRQLFQPFNRLGAEESGVEGTGIGLAIVKGLVERMDGTITARSVPGEGSTFTVCLPLGGSVAATAGAAQPPSPVTPGDPATSAVANGDVDAGASRGPVTGPIAPAASQPRADGGTAFARILYIEDNPVNTMIVAELLKRRSDLALHLAEDGASGVALARTLIPDLILLDMQLPDMDGHEVFRRLQADPGTSRIPCIALSANVLQSDIDRALTAGFDAYLTKPFEFEGFLALIDRHVHPPQNPVLPKVDDAR